jgi:hypothetical protein
MRHCVPLRRQRHALQAVVHRSTKLIQQLDVKCRDEWMKIAINSAEWQPCFGSPH